MKRLNSSGSEALNLGASLEPGATIQCFVSPTIFVNDIVSSDCKFVCKLSICVDDKSTCGISGEKGVTGLGGNDLLKISGGISSGGVYMINPNLGSQEYQMAIQLVNM